jgi:hypothetical protein
MQIALEAGTQSPWISRWLSGLGHEVIVGNPRKLRLIYQNRRKNDQVDAEYLARLARVDPALLHPLDHRGEEAQADLSVLAASLASVDADGDSLPDLDASTVSYVGFSLGGVVGTAFAAVEPLVPNVFLSAAAGGLARALEASPTFGPRIRAGLGAAGIQPGTTDYELFFTAFQTVMDSADPVNWITEVADFKNVLLHEVIGDTVLPNFVATAPLSGTEPLIRAAGLTAYSSTLMDPAGIDAAGRFVPPAAHSSLLSPAASPAATAEMQKQMASFVASLGEAVVVTDPSTMVPVVQPAAEEAPE